MRVASEARWWMVESGGRYLLMSALWDPKQLPAPHTGSCSQRSTSFYQENYSKFSRGTNPATALGFLWCTSWWQRDSQLVAEHEDMSWWLPAGRTMNFVTAQLLLVFVRISQKATNLAWLALHVKTKHQGSPFWLCFPGISSFPKWFSWAGWAGQAGKESWCSGLGPPNMHRLNIWIILHDSPGTRGSPPMLLSNSQIQPSSGKKEGREEGEVMVGGFLQGIWCSTELCPYWALSGLVMSTWRCHCWPPPWGTCFWEEESLTFAFREERKPCSFLCLYRTNIYLKPMLPKEFKFQCEIWISEKGIQSPNWDTFRKEQWSFQSFDWAFPITWVMFLRPFSVNTSAGTDLPHGSGWY